MFIQTKFHHPCSNMISPCLSRHDLIILVHAWFHHTCSVIISSCLFIQPVVVSLYSFRRVQVHQCLLVDWLPAKVKPIANIKKNIPRCVNCELWTMSVCQIYNDLQMPFHWFCLFKPVFILVWLYLLQFSLYLFLISRYLPSTLFISEHK